MDPAASLRPGACRRSLRLIRPAVCARCIISSDCFQCDFDGYQIHAVVWFTNQKLANKGYQLPSSLHTTCTTSTLTHMWRHHNPHICSIAPSGRSQILKIREWMDSLTSDRSISPFRTLSCSLTAQLLAICISIRHLFFLLLVHRWKKTGSTVCLFVCFRDWTGTLKRDICEDVCVMAAGKFEYIIMQAGMEHKCSKRYTMRHGGTFTEWKIVFGLSNAVVWCFKVVSVLLSTHDSSPSQHCCCAVPAYIQHEDSVMKSFQIFQDQKSLFWFLMILSRGQTRKTCFKSMNLLRLWCPKTSVFVLPSTETSFPQNLLWYRTRSWTCGNEANKQAALTLTNISSIGNH